jgi:tetratricopeptide (TPR) repeat protein
VIRPEPPPRIGPAPDPDELYRDRENIANAQRAADLWAERVAAGPDFEATWKLARVCYWLGTEGPDAGRKNALSRGVTAGEQAVKLEPDKPQGHFWLAANMGGLAESFGLMQGLKYRGRIKDELERVLQIDPAWQDGSADRALGWWYHQVPRLFGGSEAKAEEHLRKALGYNTQSIITLYFLAEVLIDRHKKDEARDLLQQAVAAPVDPDSAPEDRSFKRQAEAELKNLRHGYDKDALFRPVLPASTIRLSNGGAANIASLYSSNMMLAM